VQPSSSYCYWYYGGIAVSAAAHCEAISEARGRSLKMGSQGGAMGDRDLRRALELVLLSLVGLEVLPIWFLTVKVEAMALLLATWVVEEAGLEGAQLLLLGLSPFET
jgi:hypothetical protein